MQGGVRVCIVEIIKLYLITQCIGNSQCTCTQTISSGWANSTILF